jgi:hypothetical protein
MQKKKVIGIATLVAVLAGGILWASDHIDAPAVTGQSTDITDLYVYQSPNNPNNLVFVVNTQGLLAPSATAAAKFDETTLIQINIDKTGDNVEDLVIQAAYDGSNINVYGPTAPSITGLKSKLEGVITAQVRVTPYGASPIVAKSYNGMQVFAGARDDPFFFDLNQYHKILAGTATGFNNPGTDAFAGTNVLSFVIEVPKSLLGTPKGGAYNVWAQTKKALQ